VDGAVEFEIASQRMAITVDGTTGFIRTIRLRLKNEVIKTLEVTTIRRAPERPRPLFPDRFTVPIPGIESVNDRINAGAYSMGRWTVDAILTGLDRERILRKASDLKHYYRGLMEDFCRSVSESFLAAYADRSVAKLTAKGNSLEDLERQIDEFANMFEKVVKEGESVRAELVESMVTKTHDGLLECIKEAEKGTPESKAELEKIIREVLKDSKDPKFLPAIPDAKGTVRQAIQRAKDAE
jgi:hypothetical protein